MRWTRDRRRTTVNPAATASSKKLAKSAASFGERCSSNVPVSFRTSAPTPVGGNATGVGTETEGGAGGRMTGATGVTGVTGVTGRNEGKAVRLAFVRV